MLRNSPTAARIFSQRRHLSAVRQLGVVGAGQMGLGIAYVAANVAKIPVVVVDKQPSQIEKARAFVDTLLKKEVAKERLTEQDAAQTRSRIEYSQDMAQTTAADFVIEAVTENFDVKKSIFSELSKLMPPQAVLASNTSSISITKIASCTDRPEKVIGMHFMNPVPVMKLVEVIPGLATSTETLEATHEFAKALGKTTTTSQDNPGFVANRLLMPYINEAIIALQEGIATREDIDTTMKLGANMPMGPLALADFIGLDTCLAIMRVLHTEIGDSKYRPAGLLVKYVDAGWLGRKNGRGFYKYQ